MSAHAVKLHSKVCVHWDHPVTNSSNKVIIVYRYYVLAVNVLACVVPERALVGSGCFSCDVITVW